MGKIKQKTLVYAIIIILILVIGISFLMNISSDSKSSKNSGVSGNSIKDHHGTAVKQSSQTVKIGENAPDFNLKDVNGDTVKLSDYKGKNLVIFFNEGSMCYPSCWNQMLALAMDKRFNNENSATIAIVIDSKQQWEKIIAEKEPKMSAVKILLDTNKKVSLEYGALFMESSMHKGSFPGHSYFVIDKEGTLRYILDDPKMKINNDVLANELKKL